MSVSWYNVRKAGQVAAYFACQEGGTIDVLKLVKLVYLADRNSLGRYGHPIIDDRLVSMPHGPVNSITLNYINGTVDDLGEWSNYIGGRANYQVAALKKFQREDFDELSDADIEALESTWKDFGELKKFEIRDWTHNNCPEWEDPDGSAAAIPHERVLKYLKTPQAEEFSENLAADRAVEDLFASLRG